MSFVQLPVGVDPTHAKHFVAALFSPEDNSTSAMDNALMLSGVYLTTLYLHNKNDLFFLILQSAASSTKRYKPK